MERPQLTFKIELLGGLVEELAFWSNLEDGGEYAEVKFDEVLEAVREMRLVVLCDLTEYLEDVAINNEPVCLNYIRVKKELERTTFEEKRF